MKRELIKILETICPEQVYLQGTFAEDREYPDTFITFFVDDTEDAAFYDNDPKQEVWSFSVLVYSNDPLQIEEKSQEIRTKLKQAGFIAQGKGNDIMSDVPSHTGWAMDFLKIEKL